MAPTLPLPSPEQKKFENIRTVHQEEKLNGKFHASFSLLGGGADSSWGLLTHHLLDRVRLFFGIEMSFLWYRGGRSLPFGIEIPFLVSRFCILLFSVWIVSFLGSTHACFFGPRRPAIGGQEISIPKRRSKNLDTPKKTSRYQQKESPS